MQDVLLTLGCPALLIGWNGQILDPGGDLGAAIPPGLRVRGGAIHVEGLGKSRECEQLAARLAASAPQRETSNLVIIARQDGRPIVAYGYRMRGRARDMFSAAVAMILLIDTQHSPSPPPAAILATLYGLTAAECRVAMALGSGADLRSIGDFNRIS